MGKLVKQEYEKVDLNRLKPHPRNPRQGDVGAVFESIEANGFYGTIVAQKSTGHILAGNHRWMAAREAGIDSLPVVWVDVDDDRALRILLADNKTSDAASYDDSALAEILAELANTSDLLGTGYDGDDLDQLINDLAGGMEKPAPEEAPEAQIDRAEELREKWGVERGQLWQVGRHRILCGDSTSEEDVARLMDGQKADMVFTDPPYGVDYSGGIQFATDGVKKEQRKRLANDDDASIYSAVIPRIAKWCNGPVYTWFAGTKAAELYSAVEKCGEAHALIVWVKPGGYGALNANYKPKHEPCLYWKPKGATLRFTGDTTETTVWEMDKDGVNKLHPTQKPVALAQRALANHEASKVLDLFLGSGSTLCACEHLGRYGYGMELDPSYVAVTLQRLSDMGLEPRLTHHAATD